MVSKGYTVFATKVPPDQPYVAFQIAEAFIKDWPRVLKHVAQTNGLKV